jgi:hypothetical protein
MVAAGMFSGTAHAVVAMDDIKPATVNHTDPQYSVEHPYFGTTSQTADNTLAADGATLGGAVDQEAGKAAADSSAETTAEKDVRDCAKVGLFDMAFDLIWIVENEVEFNFIEQAESEIRGCLEERAINNIGVDATATAKDLTNVLVERSEEALNAEGEGDLYGWADFLYAADYYNVKE